MAPHPSTLRRLAAWSFGSLVFITACWYIARTFQWTSITPILRQVRLGWLLIGGGLSLILYWLLRAVRWHILLRRLGVRVPFLDLYLCTAAALSFAIFTPFQTGEMIKIYATGVGLPFDYDEKTSGYQTGKKYPGGLAPTTPLTAVASFIGGKTANVLAVNGTAGMVGVFELLLQVFVDLPAGNATSLTISQDLFRSNSATVPVVNPAFSAGQ